MSRNISLHSWEAIVLSNEFVESAKDNMTLTEVRLFFFLLKLIDPRSKQADAEYEIHVSDFAKFYNLSRKDLYDFIDQLTDELFKRRFKLPRQDGQKGFTKHSWITDADYLSGRWILKLKLHEKFQSCVLNLSRDFTQVPVEDLQQLRSKYSYWFIFLVSKNLKLGSREFDRDKLQAMVGAQGYKHYSDFRKRALEAAEKELREKTSFCFEWSIWQKRGRSPITLNILPKRNLAVIEARKKDRLRRPSLPLFASVEPGYVSKLVEHGISPERVKKLQRDEAADYLEWIADKIEYRKLNRKKAEPIQNHENFCLAIINGERQNFKAEETMRIEKEKRSVENVERWKGLQRMRIEEHLDKARQSHFLTEAWSQFESDPNSNKIESKFQESLMTDISRSNPYFRKIRESFESEGLKNRIVIAAFKGFLVSHWKLEESTSLSEFIQNENYRITETDSGLVLLKNEVPVSIES